MIMGDYHRSPLTSQGLMVDTNVSLSCIIKFSQAGKRVAWTMKVIACVHPLACRSARSVLSIRFVIVIGQLEFSYASSRSCVRR